MALVSGISLTSSKLHHILLCLPKREANKALISSSSSNKRRRRSFNLSILAAVICIPINPNIINANASQQQLQQDLELETYTDSKQGFTLLIPHFWLQVDKAGATVLFEEPNKSANNVGVVVNPVRLATLREFGTPEFVADKLIQSEKRKESTKDAEVIAVSERSGKGGVQVYEFEYKVDSTRGGLKRVFSATFVASKKLYILNISHSDKPESPLDLHRRTILQQEFAEAVASIKWISLATALALSTQIAPVFVQNKKLPNGQKEQLPCIDP